MTYSDATKAILAAVIAGDVCADCGAANHMRHFDECPKHPENSAAEIDRGLPREGSAEKMSATDIATKIGVTLVTNLCDVVARYFPEPVGHEAAPGRDLFAEHAAHCPGCAAADTDSPTPLGDADAPAPRTPPASVSGDGRPTSELLTEAALYLGGQIGIGTPSYVRDFVDELWDRAATLGAIEE